MRRSLTLVTFLALMAGCSQQPASTSPTAGAPSDTAAIAREAHEGLNIHHHDADGKWRVARDAWSSDLPAPTGK